MTLTKKQLSTMSHQQLNITLANKLGVKWVIRPEDNVDEPWSWQFSELGKSVTPLPDYVGGCKELCDLIVEYEIGIEFAIEGAWKVQGHGGGSFDKPWYAVVEYLLLEVEL